VLALRRSVRSVVTQMDYLIAAVATVLLFAYLIYALLRPERF